MNNLQVEAMKNSVDKKIYGDPLYRFDPQIGGGKFSLFTFEPPKL